MNASTFPPPSLSIQLLELKRERKMRAGVYPHWVQTGKIKQAVADYQCNALDGAIKTLETLTAAEGQPGRKELVAGLKRLKTAVENAHHVEESGAELVDAHSHAEALLARIPE